jgi:hypothetical protein
MEYYLSEIFYITLQDENGRKGEKKKRERESNPKTHLPFVRFLREHVLEATPPHSPLFK